jgi:drug/metabolite transporter (DMT)-like permease
LILVWGSTWSVIRVCLEGIPPFTGIALRYAMASMVLAALGVATGVHFGRQRHERRVWVSQAVLTFGVPYCVVYWAEQWVPSGLVAVLFATFPLFVVPLSRLFLPEEQFAGSGFLGLLVGFSGVAVIFSSDLSSLGSKVTLAAAVVLVAPLSAALGQVIAKRWGQGIHPFSMTAVPMAMTAVATGALAATVESGRQLSLTPRPVAALLYLTLAGSVLTFTLFYWLLQRLTSIQLSLITYAIPVVAVGIGTTLMDEPITPRILGGAVLVILGVVFAARGSSGKTATS